MSACLLIPSPLGQTSLWVWNCSAYIASKEEVVGIPLLFLQRTLRRGQALDAKRGPVEVDNSLNSWFGEVERGKVSTFEQNIL